MYERQHMRRMRQLDSKHEQMTTREKIEQRPELLEEARAHLEQITLREHELPGVHHARVLKAAGLPVWGGNRVLKSISITDGRPEHGALRSDDHVGYVQIEANLKEFDIWVEMEDGSGDGLRVHCPNCGDRRAIFESNRHHHISGYYEVRCRTCGEVFDEEEWA